jgi:hypothetical protein
VRRKRSAAVKEYRPVKRDRKIQKKGMRGDRGNQLRAEKRVRVEDWLKELMEDEGTG